MCLFWCDLVGLFSRKTGKCLSTIKEDDQFYALDFRKDGSIFAATGKKHIVRICLQGFYVTWLTTVQLVLCATLSTCCISRAYGVDPSCDEDIAPKIFTLRLMFELSTELTVIIASSYFPTVMMFFST